MTARVCPSCARPLEGLEQYRATVNVPDADAIERRRAQWRESKRRLLARKDGRVGAFHSMHCEMPVLCTCRPIPAYSRFREVG